MNKLESKIVNVIGAYLDSMGIPRVTVNVHADADSVASVYITPPVEYKDEIDELAIYAAIGEDESLADVDIEIELIDAEEMRESVDSALTALESDDEEEEDELSADNLTVLDETGGRELHMRDREDLDIEDDYGDEYYDDDETDEDLDTSEYEDDIGGIDEYVPNWDDLEEMMRGNDYDDR